MSKPEPKAEIIVEEFEFSMNIFVATGDAAAFVEREAPTYGSLFKMQDNKAYILYINSCYDLHEVAEYFRKME